MPVQDGMEEKTVSMVDFPEEERTDGKIFVRVYGETSYENQMAVLSHYLHNRKKKLSKKEKKDIVDAIKDFISRKKNRDGLDLDYLSDQDILSVAEAPGQYEIFSDFFNVPFPAPKNPRFTFIDLFAGIGGFRIALQNIGGNCVYSSEFDACAQETYFRNFGEVPFGDLTKEATQKHIPNEFDVLCAGFPCQAFSIAGHQRGFEDTRGTLFFDVAKILKEKRPKAFFLENVKNLKAHDHGRTFEVIMKTLHDLDYAVYADVLNTMEYANIPQNRERIFIVGFNKKKVRNWGDFRFPDKIALTKTIRDCIDYDIDDETLFYTSKFPHYKELVEGMTNPKTVYQWRRQYVRENKSNVCPTLTANMGMGGHNVPLIVTGKGYRKLTPKECLNFQGYPTDYSFPDTISNAMKYKQAGNSVTVPLIQRVAGKIIEIIV